MARSLLVHASFVRRLANSLTGGDGDDLAQDAWSAALQSESRDVRDATGWLATIVKNLWRNRHRGELRRVARERAAGPAEPGPSIASILELEEARRHVVAAVVALPERLRAVVLCRYYEDLDSTAIGERLGLPPSTVRSRLRDAHGQLRASLDAQHGDRRAWAAPLAGWCVPRGTGAVVLRTGASIRIAAGAVAVLLLGWWVTLLSQPAPLPPPQAPVGTVQVASHDDDSRPAAATKQEREVVASATAPAIGPEDLPGRVVDAATGAPVAGAEVVLEHRDSDEFSPFDVAHEPSIDVVGTMRTDRDGRFAFRVQRALQHRVVVTAAGYAKETLALCTGGSEVLVRVAAPATITGVVRRKSDGAPLADAVVAVAEYGGPGDWTTTRTGVDGTFVFTGLVPRAAYLSVKARGMKPDWRRAELVPATQRNEEFLLESGGTVRGVVRDGATEQPIAGARVSADSKMRDAVVSGTDGTFELWSVADTDRVHVRAVGYAPRVVWREAGERGDRVDVSMFAGAAVAGRVLDRDGRPVIGARVFAGSNMIWPGGESDTVWCNAEVGADGAFRIAALPVDGLRPGARFRSVRWQVTVRAEGFGVRAFALSPERLRLGTVDLGDVVLDRGAILEGRVVEKDGSPIADVEIRVDGAPRGFESFVPERTLLPPPLWFARTTRTAPDGAFRVAGLTSGTYSVEADHNDEFELPSVTREITGGEIANVGDLRVDRGEMIEGVVRIAGQRESAFDELVGVTASNGNALARSARVRSDGSFRLQLLLPGSHTLWSVNVPKGLCMVPRYEVPAGAKGVELVLVRPEILEGVVVDADGRPVPRAKMIFWLDGVNMAREVPADDEGRFRLEVVPGVRGRLLATHPDNQFYQASLPDVVAPQSGLTLKLRRWL